MQKKCKQCEKPFEITEGDLKFYPKVSPEIAGKRYDIPAPSLCAFCRLQRRLAWRNEHHLYQRKCDLSGRQIISMYSAEKKYPVYDVKEWWSDKWDATSYGQDFDFQKPFFEQLHELQQKVPHWALLSFNNENSDYTNCVTNLKNCYLLFSSDFNQDCYYGVWIEHSRNSVDNLLLDQSELTYESVFSQKIYNSIFVYNSSQCNDSAFLYDCKNCSNCFMSNGLRNKQYYFRNKALTKEQYEQKIAEVKFGSYQVLESLKQGFLALMKDSVQRAISQNGRVNGATGNFLTDVENCRWCFETIRFKDGSYLFGALDGKDVQDGCYVGLNELSYEICESVPSPYHSAFIAQTYTGNNLYYVMNSMNECSDCFGCVGLRRKKYCILNKQYSQEEYEVLVPKIIEHMKKTGEWGEFFPMKFSPYTYNESDAFDYFPLTEQQVVMQGLAWKKEDAWNHYEGPVVAIEDDIIRVEDSITKQILQCADCCKNYRITFQELQFYRKLGVPVPRKCFECRHKERSKVRNVYKLWKAECVKCGAAISSSHDPKVEKKVYCENCYLKEVY